ncbi:hypothetical protein ACIQVK_41310 [Streptomyces sp. NPDC090493]|uniref:hypothetical protein n=1 Tax=Streptomyces sp. NPDC090493 TaxID=3365964 RepID=UPI003804A1FC
MLTLSVGMLAATLTVGRIIRRTGKYKIFPVVGSALMTTATVLLHYRVQWNSPLPETMGYMVLFGAGLGGCFQVLMLALQNAVEPKDMGVATASATFFRQIGGTAGAAICLSVLFSSVSDNMASAFRAAYRTPGFQTALHDPAVLSNPANTPVLDMLKHPQHTGGTGPGALDDSSFIQHLDPRLAVPLKVGFTDSLHAVFLLVAAVMVIAFLVAAWTKEVPLRRMSGLESRATAERDGGAVSEGASQQPSRD